MDIPMARGAECGEIFFTIIAASATKFQVVDL
jgi:hypothetical protein